MFRKKLIIVAVIVSIMTLLIIISWPLPYALLGSISVFFQSLFSNSSLWMNLIGIFSVILALIAFFAVVLPILIFFLRKIYIYISVLNICISLGYRFKMKRNPLSSLKGMSSDGDLVIKTANKVFYLHFIDIIFAKRRALTIPNDSEYVITAITPSRISKQGVGGTNMSGSRTLVFRATEYSLNQNSDKVKKLPIISPKTNEEHILLIPTFPVELNFKDLEPGVRLSSGQRIGFMTFCSVDYLKKGLKNKLHNSIFDS